MTLVTIWGPNLRTRGETFHVHTPGCADTTKGIYRGAERPWTVVVTSVQDAVEAIYEDIIAENEGDSEYGSWEAYESDVKIFPCVGTLPREGV